MSNTCGRGIKSLYDDIIYYVDDSSDHWGPSTETLIKEVCRPFILKNNQPDH